MRDKLIALATLGQIDASTRDYDRELEAIPKSLEKLRGECSDCETVIGAGREELTELERLRDGQDLQIKDSDSSLAKGKAKQAKARTAREAEAAERELASNRETKRKREESRTELQGTIDKRLKMLENLQAEFEESRAKLQAEEAAAGKRVDELNALRSEKLGGREDIAKLLPATQLSRYEVLRKRRGVAVAEAKGGICTACRVSIRPMQFIAVQRCETFVQCDNCKTFLYFAEILESQES